jgi:hypothetical protein
VILIAALGAQTQAEPQTEAQPEPRPQAQPTFDDGLLAYHRADHDVALAVWRPLAEAGRPAAQFMLGLMYYRGEGVLPNMQKAARWYRKAADRGDADAQQNLGLMYAMGEGVKKNYVQAYKWFSLAHFHYPPGERRDDSFRNRANVAAIMTEKQIKRAEHLVKDWKPK